jgi:hypothetical protein
MATGLLGQAALAAITNTPVYTVPPNTFAVFSVCVLNRSTTATATVRIALASLSTPDAGGKEWIEYDVSLDPGGVLERTGLMMNAGKILVVYTSGSQVSVNVYGIETSTV